MAQNDPSKILMQGAKAWHEWRAQHRGPVDFANPHWYDCPGPGGIQVKGQNRINFSGMNLSAVSIYSAFAEGLNLDEAVFEDALFEEGDFSRASFRGATFRNTRFNKTILVTIEGDEAHLLEHLGNKLSAIEELHSERIMRLARRYVKADTERRRRD